MRSTVPRCSALALSVMLSCLVLSACGSMTSTALSRPERPQASLLEPCPPPPPWPTTDVPLRVWDDVAEQRTAMAAECRARHRGLSEWARKVTQ